MSKNVRYRLVYDKSGPSPSVRFRDSEFSSMPQLEVEQYLYRYGYSPRQAMWRFTEFLKKEFPEEHVSDINRRVLEVYEYHPGTNTETKIFPLNPE